MAKADAAKADAAKADAAAGAGAAAGAEGEADPNEPVTSKMDPGLVSVIPGTFNVSSESTAVLMVI